LVAHKRQIERRQLAVSYVESAAVMYVLIKPKVGWHLALFLNQMCFIAASDNPVALDFSVVYQLQQEKPILWAEQEF